MKPITVVRSLSTLGSTRKSRGNGDSVVHVLQPYHNPLTTPRHSPHHATISLRNPHGGRLSRRLVWWIPRPGLACTPPRPGVDERFTPVYPRTRRMRTPRGRRDERSADGTVSVQFDHSIEGGADVCGKEQPQRLNGSFNGPLRWRGLLGKQRGGKTLGPDSKGQRSSVPWNPEAIQNSDRWIQHCQPRGSWA